MATEAFPHRRIVVIGNTSSGKSTLAEKLARRYGLAFVELDALKWEPHWTSVSPDTFRARIDEATHGPAWAVAGNYGPTRDIVWQRAEAVIWLDYSLAVVLWRLIRRTIRRSWRRELLWGTNYERLRDTLMVWSDESLINFAVRAHWRRRREWTRLFAEPAQAHLKVLRFRHPREAERWFEGL